MLLNTEIDELEIILALRSQVEDFTDRFLYTFRDELNKEIHRRAKESP